MTTDENNDNISDQAPAEEVTAAQEESPAMHQESEFDRLCAENAELKDRVLRVQAELENFRRRSQRDALDAMKYQAMGVIRDMLPGIDNLKRAIDVTEQTGDTQQLLDGIKMVHPQFLEALKSHSCEPIDPMGQPFDANFHEALAQVPSADHPPMTVLQVIEQGYKIHDRVIRPAKVMVTRAPPEPTEEA